MITRKKLYSIEKEAVKFKRELDYSEITPSDNEATTIYAKGVKKQQKPRVMNNYRKPGRHGNAREISKKDERSRC